MKKSIFILILICLTVTLYFILFYKNISKQNPKEIKSAPSNPVKSIGKTEILTKDVTWLPKEIDEYFSEKIPKISLEYPSTETKPKETTLIFTGDILPTRWVSKRAHDNNDMSYPFRETYQITSNADFTIGDLECPFAETGPYQELGIVFRGDPELVEGLTLAGIDVVNLANNHLGDSGQAGMKFTFDLLTKNKIDYFGAGLNQTQTHTPYIKEINGIKIAILGYADADFTPTSYEADNEYAGLNLMNINQMINDVKNAKNHADFVIVSMHAGTEYTYDPDPDQIEFAHAAIDAGANMIYGTHPHVIQAIEVYKEKPIFYSLGNFAMDQIEENTRQGYLLKIKLIGNNVSDIELTPYHIYDWSQPKLTNDAENQKIINDILSASKKL